MAEVATSTRVVFTDESGRFLADIDGKARDAVWEVTRDTARFAFHYAPVDKGILRNSIRGWMVAALQGQVTADAPHAVVQEIGTNKKNYPIGRPGQWLVKGLQESVASGKISEFGPVRGPVIHPGVEGTHYLQRAYLRMREDAPEIFRRHLGV